MISVMYTCVCIYIYIYIYCLTYDYIMYIHIIYIYIYIYILPSGADRRPKCDLGVSYFRASLGSI